MILLLGPVAGVIGGRKLQTVSSRKTIYVGNALNLVVLGAITAAIDITHGRRAIDLVAGSRSSRDLLMWSVFIVAVCVTLVVVALVLRKSLRRPPKSSVIALLPQTIGEKVGFAFLCVLIAAIEEFIYRGFALSALREWLPSDTVAVGLVCVSFALMHGLQDWIAIVLAFGQGVVLSIPVLVVNSLVPSIAGHFAANLFTGLFLLGILQRFAMLHVDG